MKAFQLIKYKKDQPKYQLNDIEPQTLGSNDILIKTSIAAVNPLDNLISHGELKLVVPYSLPQTMGNEFVGTIEKLGKKVTNFKVGDRVYARNPVNNIGAFAEKVVIDKDAIAKVPDYLTDQEAAAVPLTALTAMQALDLLNAQAGQTLFISGGTGSFGTMAIPIAVARGLKVITSGNGKKQAEVEKLGVSQFINYREEDYSEILSNVDLVIDTIGGKELDKEFKILKPEGKLVSLRAMPNKAFTKNMGMGIFKQILFGLAARKIEKMAQKKHQTYNFLFVTANGKQLEEASQILAKREIHPALGNIYSLEETEDALNDVAQRKSNGKVLIQISSDKN